MGLQRTPCGTPGMHMPTPKGSITAVTRSVRVRSAPTGGVRERPSTAPAAYDIAATCHRELGQLDAATVARRREVDILERTAAGTTAWLSALVKLGDLS